MNAGDTLRVVVVDDEPLARRGIINHLRMQHVPVDVVAECGNGREAVAAIRELSPDLVFLDIQMPELDGFGVVKAIGAERMPAVIFVTAYDRYALRAFEVHAMDYLLKPLDGDRFRDAFVRAVEGVQRVQQEDLGRRLDAVLRHLEADRSASRDTPWRDRFVIKDGGRVFFVRVDEVQWIDTAGNYIRLHVGSRSLMLRGTMEATAGELDPERFIRIRRSTLVNVDAVKELRTLSKGTYKVVLVDGTELASSRNYRSNLDDFFERHSWPGSSTRARATRR
jgi:two-component system LytT family response regulator